MANTPAQAPTTAITIQTPEKSWGQPQRLSVARSHAFSLLANGADEEQIARACRAITDDLAAALDGWHEEATALCDLAEDPIEAWLREEIGGFMRLTMGRYSDQARQEFSDQCSQEFAEIPVDMLTRVVRDVRRKCSWPEKFVPMVFEALGDRLAQFQREGQMLERLAKIAGVDDAS